MTPSSLPGNDRLADRPLQPSNHLHSTQELRSWAGSLGVDSIHYYIDRDAMIAADPAADPLEVECATERLQALREALARFDRVSRMVAGIPTTTDQRYAGWSELARVVRERVEVPDILLSVGHELRPVGRNSRRGSAEYSGSCPVCGGSDRLRVWGGSFGRAWCRQCAWSADVIAIVQSFVPEAAEFRDAIRWLANRAGAAPEVPR